MNRKKEETGWVTFKTMEEALPLIHKNMAKSDEEKANYMNLFTNK